MVLIGSAGPASAHPHVWIRAAASLIFANGTLTAIKEHWVFDPLFSEQTLAQLDVDEHGQVLPEGLRKLAEVSARGLKDLDYFTYPTLGGAPLEVGSPQDFTFEVVTDADPPGPASLLPPGARARMGVSAAQVLALSFTLPLAIPVLADAPDFALSITDPSFFYWYELDAKSPITLVGAPAGCAVAVDSAQPTSNELSALQAFDGQLGSTPPISIRAMTTVRLTCP